jgi:proteasome-associated ATPase
MSEQPDQTRSPEQAESEITYLRAEVEHLRRRVSAGPSDSRSLEARLAETQARLSTLSAQNERLTTTLREARDQILTLKEEVDRLAQPPTGFGTFLGRNDDETVDVFTAGR